MADDPRAAAPEPAAAAASAVGERPVRRRRPGRAWLPPAVLVLGLLVLLATGGFRAAPAAGVRSFAVGEPVVLQRWVLAVESVELVDTTTYGSPSPPTLRVRLSATWTGTRSTYALATGLVGVVVPGGPAAAQEPSTPQVDGYSGGFDPDVARPVLLELTWPADAPQGAPRTPAPTAVDVVLSDERPAQNFLFRDEWTTTRPLGHVRVPVLDRRAA